jgi:hypothetical protein
VPVVDKDIKLRMLVDGRDLRSVDTGFRRKARTLSQVAWVGLCGALLVSASGCNRSTSQPDPSTDGWQYYMQFAVQATEQFCNGVSTCCSSANFPFDRAGCEAFEGPIWDRKFTSQVAAGSFYDRAAGQRCLDEITQSLQSCVAGAGAPLTDCDSVFIGFVPLGQPCDNDSKCAAVDGGVATCKVQGDALSGICTLEPPVVAPPHPQAGDACSGTCVSADTCICADAACQSSAPACQSSDGLYCSDSAQCVAAGVTGDPCNASFACATGFYCDLVAQQCAPLQLLGAACTRSIECESYDCIAGTCSPQMVASKEFCVGKIPPAPM